MITELLNSGLLFSFFDFKISELCHSEVLFLLNVSPIPYGPSKAFFWIKLQSQTRSNVTPKNLLLHSYCSLYPRFNVAEQQKIYSLAASVAHISTLNEGRGGIGEALHSFQTRLWVQKTKAATYEISRTWILILLILLVLNLLILKLK